MVGLPSTTEVDGRLPKEAFYRNMKIGSKLREQFISEVDSISLVNTIKPSTANVADGRRVHEIQVIDVEPKRDEVPDAILMAIDSANPHRKVFVSKGGDELAITHRDKPLRVGGPRSLSILGNDLDEVWDSLLAQLVFDDENGNAIRERLGVRDRILALEREVAKLEAKSRRATQFARKNELYSEARASQEELERLKEYERKTWRVSKTDC